MARMKTTGPSVKRAKAKVAASKTAKPPEKGKRQAAAKFSTTAAAVLVTETSMYDHGSCDPHREVFASQELANAFVLKRWKEFAECECEELELFENEAGFFKVTMSGYDGSDETYEAQPWSSDLQWKPVERSSDDMSDAYSD